MPMSSGCRFSQARTTQSVRGSWILREHGLTDVLVVLGGIIPDADLPTLKAMGISGVFRPGTSMQEIIDFIEANRPSTGANGAGASGR
jgi:methylmalonyl-CoA mutase C-terminal domain/subunit